MLDLLGFVLDMALAISGQHDGEEGGSFQGGCLGFLVICAVLGLGWWYITH